MLNTSVNQVDAVTPAVGSLEGGSLLQVTGSDFSEDHAVVSLAGVLLSAGASRWVSSTLILVRAPPAVTPGLVQIEVTNAPGSAAKTSPGSSETFRYAVPVAVTSVVPSSLDVMVGGGGVVTIVGEKFLSGVDYACRSRPAILKPLTLEPQNPKTQNPQPKTQIPHLTSNPKPEPLSKIAS